MRMTTMTTIQPNRAATGSMVWVNPAHVISVEPHPVKVPVRREDDTLTPEPTCLVSTVAGALHVLGSSGFVAERITLALNWPENV